MQTKNIKQKGVQQSLRCLNHGKVEVQFDKCKSKQFISPIRDNSSFFNESRQIQVKPGLHYITQAKQKRSVRGRNHDHGYSNVSSNQKSLGNSNSSRQLLREKSKNYSMMIKQKNLKGNCKNKSNEKNQTLFDVSNFVLEEQKQKRHLKSIQNIIGKIDTQQLKCSLTESVSTNTVSKSNSVKKLNSGKLPVSKQRVQKSGKQNISKYQYKENQENCKSIAEKSINRLAEKRKKIIGSKAEPNCQGTLTFSLRKPKINTVNSNNNVAKEAFSKKTNVRIYSSINQSNQYTYSHIGLQEEIAVELKSGNSDRQSHPKINKSKNNQIYGSSFSIDEQQFSGIQKFKFQSNLYQICIIPKKTATIQNFIVDGNLSPQLMLQRMQQLQKINTALVMKLNIGKAQDKASTGKNLSFEEDLVDCSFSNKVNLPDRLVSCENFTQERKNEVCPSSQSKIERVNFDLQSSLCFFKDRIGFLQQQVFQLRKANNNLQLKIRLTERKAESENKTYKKKLAMQINNWRQKYEDLQVQNTRLRGAREREKQEHISMDLSKDQILNQQ